MPTFNAHTALQMKKEAIITLAQKLQCHDNYPLLKVNVQSRLNDAIDGYAPGNNWELNNTTLGMKVLFLDPDDNVSSGFYSISSLPDRNDNQPLDDDDTIGLSSDTSSLEAFKSELFKYPDNDGEYIYAAIFAGKIDIVSVTGLDKPHATEITNGYLIKYFNPIITINALEREFTFKITVVDDNNERALQGIHDSHDSNKFSDDVNGHLILNSLLYAIEELHENLDQPEINLTESQIEHISLAFCDSKN